MSTEHLFNIPKLTTTNHILCPVAVFVQDFFTLLVFSEMLLMRRLLTQGEFSVIPSLPGTDCFLKFIRTCGFGTKRQS